MDISDDGSFVVAWTPEQSAPPSVWVQAFVPDGSHSGAPIQVSPAEQVVTVRPNVATDAQGNFIAAWTAEDDPVCYARRFNQDGTPVEDAWAVSAPGEVTTSPCDVDMASDGRFAVTWVADDSDDGFLHSYDTSGQLLGVAQVNQHGPVHVDHPRERHVPQVSVYDQTVLDSVVSWHRPAPLDDGRRISAPRVGRPRMTAPASPGTRTRPPASLGMGIALRRRTPAFQDSSCSAR